MDRLVLLIACVAQIGCQSPTSLFGTRQTRVPAPPTGVIRGDDYYSSPTPTDGAYVPPLRGTGEQITGVGPWRYWESANETRSPGSNLQAVQSRQPTQNGQAAPSRPLNSSLNRTASFDRNRGQNATKVAANNTNQSPLATVKKNDRLRWKEPQFGAAYNESSYSEFAQQQLPVGVPMNSTPVGSGYPPRLLPQTGPVAPLASRPVRIRSFPNSYSSQPVGIPAELAQFQNNRVRQASATAPDWRQRYDDVRR